MNMGRLPVWAVGTCSSSATLGSDTHPGVFFYGMNGIRRERPTEMQAKFCVLKFLLLNIHAKGLSKNLDLLVAFCGEGIVLLYKWILD